MYFNEMKKKQRIYYERDFKAFRELKKLLSNSVPFADATKAVASTDLSNKNAKQTPSVYSEMIRLSKRELEEVVTDAMEKEREKILEALEEKLNNAIEMRDRMLMHQMRKSLEENNKLITVAQEEKKKGFFARLFGKKEG